MAAERKPSHASTAPQGDTARVAQIEQLLDETEASLEAISRSSAMRSAQRFDLPTWDDSPTTIVASRGVAVAEASCEVSIEFGRSTITAEEAAMLEPNSLVALENSTTDLVDVYVGKNLIARGEVMVMNGLFCVRVAELIARDRIGGRAA